MTNRTKTRIGLTGLPGSGKSTFMDLLDEALRTHAIPHGRYSLSDEVREITLLRNLDPSRPNLKETANTLRKRYGADIMAELLCRSIRATPGCQIDSVWVLDGIRTPDEVETLRRHFGESFVLIGITAPEEAIAARLRSRARPDEDPRVSASPSAMKSFLAEEGGATEPAYGLKISDALAKADLLVSNQGTLEDLRQEVQRLVETCVSPAFPRALLPRD
jgi:dephospho-CoA kinase